MNSGLLHVLESIDAVKNGHFVLSSGKHSDTYFQMALAFQHYDITMEIAEDLIALFEEDMVDVVIGPAIGAIILAYEVAKLLEARAIFAERNENGNMELMRGFEINPGDRVLIVEDVYATGKYVKEIADIVKNCGGEIVGIGAVINRSSEKSPKIKGKRLKSLLKIKSNLYDSSKCPLCKENIPVE